MKKLKTTMVSLILMICMMCPLFVGCSKEPEVDLSSWEFEYISTTDTYKIDYYYGNDAEITLPSSYKDKVVTTVGYASFYHSNATKVVIPDSIKTIEDYAFYSCNRLRKLTIGSGVEHVGEKAFGLRDKITGYYTLKLLEVNNQYVFSLVDDSNNIGLSNAQTIKVPKSVADNATNDYLNNTDNFTKTTDGDYYIYTRVNN